MNIEASRFFSQKSSNCPMGRSSLFEPCHLMNDLYSAGLSLVREENSPKKGTKKRPPYSKIGTKKEPHTISLSLKNQPPHFLPIRRRTENLCN